MQIKTENIDEIVIVSLNTETLDTNNSKEFKNLMAPIIQNHSQIVLDLGAMNFVDSSGLGAILSCLRQINAKGGDLKLFGMNNKVRTLFELVRMHRIFEIFNTKEAVIKAFSQGTRK